MSVLTTAPLSDVAEINPPLNQRLASDELVAFVPMSRMSADRATVHEEEKRTFGEVAKGYTPFISGDVLVAKITPCFENGKIAQAQLTSKAGFGSTEFHVVRPHNGKLDARYALHFLRQDRVRDAGERKMTGTAGQKRVPEHFLSQLEIPLPPLVEQRRIAGILDKAEALRAKRRAALAKIDLLPQAIFLELFGDPATNAKGWPRKTLRALGSVVTGGTPPSAKPGMFDGPIPFVTPGDLESGQTIKRSLTAEGAKESKTVRSGATLVCCIGATIGKIDIARARSAFNQQINAVQWSSEVDDLYGYGVLRFFKPTIKAWGASTTMPILKKSAFEQIEIPVPPLALQQQFASMYRATEKLRSKQKISLNKCDELCASLQHRAFTAQL